MRTHGTFILLAFGLLVKIRRPDTALLLAAASNGQLAFLNNINYRFYSRYDVPHEKFVQEKKLQLRQIKVKKVYCELV